MKTKTVFGKVFVVLALFTSSFVLLLFCKTSEEEAILGIVAMAVCYIATLVTMLFIKKIESVAKEKEAKAKEAKEVRQEQRDFIQKEWDQRTEERNEKKINDKLKLIIDLYQNTSGKIIKTDEKYQAITTVDDFKKFVEWIKTQQ